jgi:hypothetical protein
MNPGLTAQAKCRPGVAELERENWSAGNRFFPKWERVAAYAPRNIK